MTFYFGRKKAGKLESVESKSISIASDGFTPTSKNDYDAFISALPPLVPPKVEKPIDAKKLKTVLKGKGIIADESEIEVD